ncbi:MAG: bifunctional 5,10-methylenetetrahydrofolate dehydrogenase/5,10-methenyltetrahydrofolate cyclohydrolase [Actinobacteria bacterium]|nr:bifunctional 5,10-methylenetetrahydrofolate dehydrogenase/5,10-methenyltetrahydrofolate cyclohydrolase [Actinomycetota bacterium]
MQRTPGGAILLDGLRLRDESLANIKATIANAGGPKICLTTVLIGDDPPSHVYVNSKHKKAQEVGMVSRGINLPATATQAQVEDVVAELVADDSVHGILVQLPLPKHIDTEAILRLLPAEKDVDGLTEKSMGRLVRGIKGHVPCTPLGVFRLLQRYEIGTKGKRVVVIGRSTLVGLPQMLLLVRRGVDATVTVAHSSTHDILEVCRESDIIIAAAGSARMVTAAHVKPGATVIDVGVTRINGKTVGDVDFDAVQAIAGAITPMPGGTGPMTIACLLENTLEAARMLNAI